MNKLEQLLEKTLQNTELLIELYQKEESEKEQNRKVKMFYEISTQILETEIRESIEIIKILLPQKQQYYKKILHIEFTKNNIVNIGRTITLLALLIKLQNQIKGEYNV